MTSATDELAGKCSLVTHLLAESYGSPQVRCELQRAFAKDDYVKLPGLIGAEAFAHIRAEIEYLRPFATKRSFMMEEYATPREMHTLGGSRILREAPTLWALYCHHELRQFIQTIAGAEIHSCRHPNEFMVANFLLSPGATHGWHLDDPAYAFIVILESCSVDDGGSVEFIADWERFCEDNAALSKENVGPIVERARAAHRVEVRHHVAGDAYLLRADRCLHQVTALRRDGVQRIALNLAFEATSCPTYGTTADRLYGDS